MTELRTPDCMDAECHPPNPGTASTLDPLERSPSPKYSLCMLSKSLLPKTHGTARIQLVQNTYQYFAYILDQGTIPQSKSADIRYQVAPDAIYEHSGKYAKAYISSEMQPRISATRVASIDYTHLSRKRTNNNGLRNSCWYNVVVLRTMRRHRNVSKTSEGTHKY